MAGTESSPPMIVCDAGPLIHLDQIGCADLLSDFPRVLVPKTVWEEVSRHRSAALTRPKLSLESQIFSLPAALSRCKNAPGVKTVRP
jgi:hypothetical protein